MRRKRWNIAPTASQAELRRYRGVSTVLAQILLNRGFHDTEAAYRFLYSKDGESNPFSMKGVNQAVTRLRAAIKNREKIVVYGDFDADGVTSTTLLVQVLRTLNADVEPYIPHRIDEGYGLNSEALYTLAKRGVKLVVTVDCGIRSVQEVEDGKAAGLDIIITDHHSIGPELPRAYTIVNPQQEDCKYPEKKLAGVGVAYTLADALLRAANANGRKGAAVLKADDLIDLVAIGTVADLMPLDHLENRMLVRRGLEKINVQPRPGIQALLEVAGVQIGGVSATSIGFTIGPRINAAGRLDSAMLAYELLSARTLEEAKGYAQKLQSLNAKRQDLTREAQELVSGQIADGDQALIFASDEHFPQGIVGLVAGRLVETYYRPTVIVQQGVEESHGSARSIPQFDITRALDQCADLLVRHGGHALAAGFTVINDNLNPLRERLTAIARATLDGQELTPTLNVDALVDVNQLSEALVDELALLEPMGYMNPQPVFATLNARMLECRTVGKDEQHLKLRLARAGQPPLDGIGFGLGEWAGQLPERVDVAYSLEINEWNGRRTLQVNVQDIRPAGVE